MNTPVFSSPPDAGELYNQRLTIGVLVTCLSLAMISFALRIYARVSTHAKLWWDDYWMFVVMAVCIAMTCCESIGLVYGSGRHFSELSPSTFLAFMKTLYFYMLTWAFGVFAVKVGILLFYWRVFHTRGFRIGAIVVGCLSAGIFLSNFFSFTFQCWPISKFWDPEEPGECFNQNDFYLASAIINVFGDVAVLFLPLPVVWNLNTSKNKKWSLSFLFLLGAFVCVASVFRIIAVNEINPLDFTYTNVGGGLWSTVEVEIGFICANLPAIRPVFFKLFKLGGSSGRTEGNTTACPRCGYGTGYGNGTAGKSGAAAMRSGYGVMSNSRSAARRVDDLEMMATKTSGSDEIELTKSEANSSHGPDLGGKNGIRVQTDVEMSVEDWRASEAHENKPRGNPTRGVGAYGGKVDSFVIIQGTD